MATPPPHRAAPPRAPESDAPDADMRDTRKRKKVTDSARMPALRLNQRDRAPRAARKPRMVYDMTRAPGYLRLARLGVGLAALGLAWGAALLVAYLAESLWMVLPNQPVLTERFALYALGGFGVLWLGVVTLALIVVGAFSLFLALARRGW
jgi:hypothetical protein